MKLISFLNVVFCSYKAWFIGARYLKQNIYNCFVIKMLDFLNTYLFIP